MVGPMGCLHSGPAHTEPPTSPPSRSGETELTRNLSKDTSLEAAPSVKRMSAFLGPGDSSSGGRKMSTASNTMLTKLNAHREELDALEQQLRGKV